MTKNSLTYKGRVITDLEIDNLDYDDYPDFCDAYFSYAIFDDTKEVLSDDELYQLTTENGDVVNEMAFQHYID